MRALFVSRSLIHRPARTRTHDTNKTVCMCVYECVCVCVFCFLLFVLFLPQSVVIVPEALSLSIAYARALSLSLVSRLPPTSLVAYLRNLSFDPSDRSLGDLVLHLVSHALLSHARAYGAASTTLWSRL